MWGRYERVIVTSGLSKAYGLPGLRIGWVAGPPAIVEELWGVHDYTTIAPGAMNDRLARIALSPARRERLLARTRGHHPRQLSRRSRRWIDKRAPASRTCRRRPARSPSCGTATRSTRPRSSSGCATSRACSSCLAITSRWTATCASASATIRAHLAGSARRASAELDAIPAGADALDLALIGFGNVGRRFVRLLDEQRARLLPTTASTCRIVGIATGARRRHSERHRSAAAAHVEAGGCAAIALSTLHPPPRSRIADRRACGVRVVETTTLEHRAPAAGHRSRRQAALAAGCHVVTANKGPAAFAYARARATRRTRAGAVVPVRRRGDGRRAGASTWCARRCRRSPCIGFRGVVNSTTNHILTALEERRGLRAARCARMQALGIAEADPSLDVDGWDAAAKTAALANVLMGARDHAARRPPPGDRRRTAERRAAPRASRAAAEARRLGGTNGGRRCVYVRGRTARAAGRRPARGPRAARRTP